MANERNDAFEVTVGQEADKPIGIVGNITASWRYIIGIPICILIVFVAGIWYIGDEAFTYSSQTYEDMQTNVQNSLTPEVGMDVEILKKGMAGPRDEFSISYKNQQTSVESIAHKGLFSAKLITKLSEDYQLIGVSDKVLDYKWNWIKVGGVLILLGAILWVVIECIYQGYLVIATIITKKYPNLGKRQKKDDTAITLTANE